MEVVNIALNEEHRNMQVNDAKNKKHAIQVQARTNAEEIEPSRKYASLNNFLEKIFTCEQKIGGSLRSGSCDFRGIPELKIL